MHQVTRLEINLYFHSLIIMKSTQKSNLFCRLLNCFRNDNTRSLNKYEFYLLFFRSESINILCTFQHVINFSFPENIILLEFVNGVGCMYDIQRNNTCSVMVSRNVFLLGGMSIVQKNQFKSSVLFILYIENFLLILCSKRMW